MISVVMPCYNAGKYVARAIESTLAQTRPVGEVIVIDDCSTDDSPEVASRYPVAILRTPGNSGPSAARNLGIAAARGDLIAWLDADDFWEENHCEVTAGLLDKYPEAAVAFSSIRFLGGHQTWPARFFECCREPSHVFWECLQNTIVPAMTAMTRARAVRAVGGFNPEFRSAVDFDFWLRLSRRFPFVSSPEITSNYRRHEGQISSLPNRQRRSVYECRSQLLDAVEAEGDFALARHIAKKNLEIWVEDLRWASHGRDAESLRFHLSLRRLLPGKSQAGPWAFLRAHAAACLYGRGERLSAVSRFVRDRFGRRTGPSR